MNIQGSKFSKTCLAVFILSCWPTTNLVAKEISIYRWVDANNVVHFSQNLPKNENHTQLSTISSFKALSKEKRKDKAQQVDLEVKKSVDIAQNKAILEKNCKAALFNIKMLNSYDEVLITEESSDGVQTERVLSQKEKTEKLALNKKNIDIYCDQ